MLTYVTSGRFTITKSRVKCQVWHFSMTFSFPRFQSSSLGPQHPRGASGHWPCPLPYCFAVLYVISGNDRVSPVMNHGNFGISTRSQNFAIYDLYLYTSPPKKHQLESTTIKWRFQRLRSWNGNTPHLLKPPENHRGWGFATMTIGRDDQMPETLQGHRAMNTKL